MLPYALVCAVDNSANGLSVHQGGPVQVSLFTHPHPLPRPLSLSLYARARAGLSK